MASGTNQTFADRAIAYAAQLTYTGKPLPPNVHVMNPFVEGSETMRIVKEFYTKYYSDNRPRHMILGINPGRFGGAITGIPFTDPKRLVSELGIAYNGVPAHEPSSVYVYEMINAYGGAAAFYGDFYINSLSPLGFAITDEKGKLTNHNFYDTKQLQDAAYNYMVENVKKQLALGINTNLGFCFGTGENWKFLKKFNADHGFFKEIIPLEHPRYIMQYHYKTRDRFIEKYLEAFGKVKVN